MTQPTALPDVLIVNGVRYRREGSEPAQPGSNEEEISRLVRERMLSLLEEQASSLLQQVSDGN